MTVTISDLRHIPEFFDTVVDRIWQAWWKRHGVPEAYIVERLRENMAGNDLPIAFVAHRGATFLGTASLLVSDLDERRQYTPWVAAVWIEPDARGQGLAPALIAHACAEAFARGHGRVYLCAVPVRRSYYMALGWEPIENEVGPLTLTVFVKARPAT
ncbi:GNAT family N-acetyltransferase [Tardiphaga alba]|uniref:GNAT family N-acetyltransferase n=1 Tax=Tardiphaga alba TaxID=340268 RepID=A0ABX8A3Z1_9BRAD|nr:GNAT family N-acetyltransferase [Tardiphaga alba]QUS38379.1 GNAT family N-acetyltransferase [Tardiphaga alba]